MKTVLVQCWRGGEPVMNLGEWLCEPILAGLGVGVRYWPDGATETEEPPVMIVGSEFHLPHIERVLGRAEAVYVWGQGNGRPEYPACKVSGRYASRLHVAAVRGTITAQVSGAYSVPRCDPGWLMPSVLPLTRRPSGEVLHVPHWEQRPGLEPWLDVMLTREQLVPTIQRLVDAEFVLTSSLHTMIMCMAYGTPCALHSPGELNMPQKWRDVFDVVPQHCETVEQGRLWWLSKGQWYHEQQNTAGLLASFPHEVAR